MARFTDSRSHQNLVRCLRILQYSDGWVKFFIIYFTLNDVPLSPFMMTHIREPTHLSISSSDQMSKPVNLYHEKGFEMYLAVKVEKPSYALKQLGWHGWR